MQDTINRVFETLECFTKSPHIIKVGAGASMILSNFFVPIIPIILTCFGLTIVDMIYGIKVARKQRAKIESRRNRNGTIKKMKDVAAILIMVRGIELYLLSGVSGTVLVGSVATIIAFTELWSILENMNTLNPKGPWRALSKFMRVKGTEVIGMDIKELQEKEEAAELKTSEHKSDKL